MVALRLLAALALLGVSGCATTAGFGRDVESAGVAIQREVAAATAPQPRPTITPNADVYVPPAGRVPGAVPGSG